VSELEERLVEIIESKATEVSQRWYRDMQESHYIPTMHNVSEDEGMRMAMTVYSNLGKWLSPTGSKEIKDTYRDFGSSMFHRGFDMEEVVMVLILLKRYLWLALLEMGLMTTDLNIYQTLELNNKVVLYYDRGIYFALIGYRESKAVSQRAVKA
jgi:hypothetical protein